MTAPQRQKVALARALLKQPDLLIVDVVLPKMNGYQLCQSVRSNPSFADIGIIFVTGKARSRDRKYAARMGGDAFLAKPFEMESLLDLCLGLTSRPGFQVRPKRLSSLEMRMEEASEERQMRQRREKLEKIGDKSEEFEPKEKSGPKWI